MQQLIAFSWCERPFPLFSSFPFFLSFFLKKRGVFFQGARGATIRLAIFFKELLKNISEIYLQGRLTAKAQTVCLELGPLFSISKSPLPPARVIRGAYTGAVQSYLTFSIKLLTFFWLDISLYFSQTLLTNAKLARGCQNYKKLCF